MAFQKFRADQLFDGYRMLDQQSVLITDSEGVVEDVVHENDAGDDVQVFTGILTPGFINCHCHLELSHMKGTIPEKTGLIKFVTQVMKDREIAETEIIQQISNAEDEMLRNGIVAVGDICNNKLTLPQKQKGRLSYHNFIEASGFVPGLAEIRFNRAVDLFTAYAQLYPIPVASNSIVAHAPYSVSDELWKNIIHFPGNQLMTIHNQETEDENQLFLKKQGGFPQFYENFKIDCSFFVATGKSSLQTYLSKFLSNQHIILVHNVYTSEEDLIYCRRSISGRLHWCLCPNANLFISGQLPDIEMLMKYNASIVLGTDSLASNHQLSIVAEMKTIRQHFPFIKTEKLLEWATMNGARALQMDNILGSFEKGKRPGVVLCEKAFSCTKRLL
jgi:cytosine/adenosine deaminase-related metal-dependent hydrolase